MASTVSVSSGRRTTSSGTTRSAATGGWAWEFSRAPPPATSLRRISSGRQLAGRTSAMAADGVHISFTASSNTIGAGLAAATRSRFNAGRGINVVSGTGNRLLGEPDLRQRPARHRSRHGRRDVERRGRCGCRREQSSEFPGPDVGHSQRLRGLGPRHAQQHGEHHLPGRDLCRRVRIPAVSARGDGARGIQRHDQRVGIGRLYDRGAERREHLHCHGCRSDR